ncbi:MAG: serine dehydratase, partial [Pirellulaceae bacterium]
MKTPPSIFNDVLGPVMRGPSSSHSAAANRIGRLARQLVDEPIRSLTVTYDPNGSLVTTHRDQGSDMGLYS